MRNVVTIMLSFAVLAGCASSQKPIQIQQEQTTIPDFDWAEYYRSQPPKWEKRNKQDSIENLYRSIRKER